MRVAADFDWTSAGEVILVDGRLVFPRLPTMPHILQATKPRVILDDEQMHHIGMMPDSGGCLKVNPSR